MEVGLGLARLMVIYGGATFVLGGSALAAPLEEELARLLLDHPQIQQASKTAEGAREEINKAGADFFPKVSITADAGPEHIDNPTTRANVEGPKDFARTRNTATVKVTQNLFKGYLTTTQVRTAQLNREIAELSLVGTRQNTLFEGVQTYVDVLRQKRLIELARENENTIQRQLNLEDERVQRGSGVAVDVLQAKSRLQIAKERRVGFEGALEDAISKYTQVFNRAPDIATMIDPAPPVELIPSELNTAIQIALSENPAVNNAGVSIEVAREKQNLVVADRYPQVDLEGLSNYEKHKNSTLGTRRDYSVVLRATWELFSGFSSTAASRQAGFEYRASQDNQMQVSRKITEQVKLAWQSLITARERLELLENAVNIASEVFESRKKLREAGKETVINVLDAENEVNNAQINFTGVSYDERVAAFQLLLSMGRLNAATLGLPVQ